MRISFKISLIFFNISDAFFIAVKASGAGLLGISNAKGFDKREGATETSNLESPTSNEANISASVPEPPGVEFSLISCSDEADGVSFDGAPELSSVVDTTGPTSHDAFNSFDGCDSDIDYCVRLNTAF